MIAITRRRTLTMFRGHANAKQQKSGMQPEKWHASTEKKTNELTADILLSICHWVGSVEGFRRSFMVGFIRSFVIRLDLNELTHGYRKS